MESAGRIGVAVFGRLVLDGHDVPSNTTHGRVLAVLASRCNQRVWLDELADAVWPDGPTPSYRKAIQVAVFKLRRAVNPPSAGTGPGPDWLLAHPGAYELRCRPDDVDAHQFEQLVRRGLQLVSQNQLDLAAATLRTALAMWAEPFGGDEVPTLQPWVEQLRATRRAAEDGLLEVDVRLGDEDVDELRRAVDEEPYDERRWGFLMIGLYRRGRQADALAVFAEARALLIDELGLEPGPYLRRVQEQILLQDGPLLVPSSRPQSVPARRWPVPPIAPPLLLRGADCDGVESRLAAGRLITITGPPGVGKTSIASTVSGRWTSTPVAWLSLADVPRTAGWIVDLAGRLGVVSERPLDERSFVEVTAAFIGDAPLLLALDNAEHLADIVAPVVDELLRSCPNLVVLATSRRPLGCVAEHVHALRPFSALDRESQRSGSDPVLSDAARFLVQRGGIRSGALSRGDVDALNQIGVQLGGLALGLEQAAARLDRFTPAELAGRLELLDGGDDTASLRRSIEWSLQLLDPVQLDLLAALARLESSFALAHAEDVGEELGIARSIVGGILSDLLSQSLVVVDDRDPADSEDEARRRIIEPVRQQLRRREVADVDRERWRRACAVVVVRRVEDAAGKLEGLDQPAGVSALRILMPEIRGTVIAAASAGDAATVARILAALRLWWWASGTYADGQALYRIGEPLLRGWTPSGAEREQRIVALSSKALVRPGFAAPSDQLDDLLTLLDEAGETGSPAVVGWVSHLVAAGLAFGNDDLVAAKGHARSSLDAARACGDRWLAGWALYASAIARARDEPVEGLELLEQASASFAVAGDRLSAARVTMFRAHGLRIFGVTDVADSAFDEARAWCADAGGAPVTQLDCELGVAQTAHAAGRHDEAADRYRSLVPRLAAVGDDRCAAVAQRALASLLVESGDVDGANALVLRALEEFRRLGSEDTEIASACLVRAEVAVRRSQPQFAAKLVGHARRLATGSGVPVELRELRRLDELVIVLAEQLGSERFETLARIGADDDQL